MRTAVLGTGVMGAAMARAIQRAGLEVRAWNRTYHKAGQLEADGVSVYRTAAETVRGADVVITMLHDTDSVLGVVRPLVEPLADAVWLQMATIGIDGTDRIHELAQQHGLAVLDAPVLGTKTPAENGTLVVLVAGNPVLEQRVAPVLDAVGSRTLWVADHLGPATALKLVVNSWVGTVNAAIGQSIALAAALDLEPQLFLDAIGGGPTDTPYAQLKGRLMVDREYPPSFTVDNARKDIDLIRAAADRTGVDTALLEALRWLYAHTSELGHGGEDMSAVHEAFPAADRRRHHHR